MVILSLPLIPSAVICTPRNSHYKLERTVSSCAVFPWISWSLQAVKEDYFWNRGGKKISVLRPKMHLITRPMKVTWMVILQSYVRSVCNFVLTPAANIDLTFLILYVNVTKGPIKWLLDCPVIALWSEVSEHVSLQWWAHVFYLMSSASLSLQFFWVFPTMSASLMAPSPHPLHLVLRKLQRSVGNVNGLRGSWVMRCGQTSQLLGDENGRWGCGTYIMAHCMGSPFLKGYLWKHTHLVFLSLWRLSET